MRLGMAGTARFPKQVLLEACAKAVDLSCQVEAVIKRARFEDETGALGAEYPRALTELRILVQRLNSAVVCAGDIRCFYKGVETVWSVDLHGDMRDEAAVVVEDGLHSVPVPQVLGGDL